MNADRWIGGLKALTWAKVQIILTDMMRISSMRSVLQQKMQIGFEYWKKDIYLQTNTPKL